MSEANRVKNDEATELRESLAGPDEMIDSGDIDEPVPHGQFLELSALVHGFKVRRDARGLSLTDVSQRSGLTRAAISRLENGWTMNPTLETLYRYALALDAHIALAAEEIANGQE